MTEIWDNFRGGEDAKIETLKAWREERYVEGLYPPHPIRGLGERRKLPQWSPGPKMDLAVGAF